MKMYLKIYITLSLLLVTLLMFSACSVGIKPAVVNDVNQAPETVWQALSNIQLEPGVYYFTEKFSNDNFAYFAICGGEQGQANYNVAITDFNYERQLEHIGTTSEARSGIYHVTYDESDLNPRPDYSSNSDYPFVLFKIKKGSPYDRLVAKSNNNEVKINYWWGANSIYGSTEDFNYEVIEKQEDIPEAIWNVVTELNLERGLYDFENRDYNTGAYYGLLCGGEEFSDAYNISFEYVDYEKFNDAAADIDGRITFTIREIDTNGILQYAEGFKYPFVIIKVEGRNNDVYTLNGGVRNNIRVLNNNFKEQGELTTNWNMRP